MYSFIFNKVIVSINLPYCNIYYCYTAYISIKKHKNVIVIGVDLLLHLWYNTFNGGDFYDNRKGKT